MPTTGDAEPTHRDPVVTAMVLAGIFLVAAYLAVSGWPSLTLWRPQRFVPRLLAAAVIGGFVGFAELVTRYRDEPWRIAATPPGMTFVAMNALAGGGALAMLEHFNAELHAPSDGILRVILAGTGAMVILRSKLFSIRQSDGSSVAVGPGLAVDTFLAAVNRDVDRRRAVPRHRKVIENAKALARFGFNIAQPYLEASMFAFQTLDLEERTRLKAALDAYVANRTMPDEIKFALAGFDILTAFGEQTYDTIFAGLQVYLRDFVPPPP